MTVPSKSGKGRVLGEVYLQEVLYSKKGGIPRSI